MPENPVTGPLDAQELLALLKVRYPAPSWAPVFSCVMKIDWRLFEMKCEPE